MDDELAEKFEIYSEVTIPEGCFFAVRVDGRAFHTEVKRMGFARPLDWKLRKAMIDASIEVMKDSGAVCAYTESDETTFIFPKECSLFNRRAEKISSIVAAKMSVAFNKLEEIRNRKASPVFDARVLVLPTLEDVVRCLEWRRLDSKRNGISTVLFWKLVQSGVSKRKATSMMSGMKDKRKRELLTEIFEIDFETYSEWEKFGTVILTQEKEKDGYNPITKENVKCTRREFIYANVSEPFNKKSVRDLLGE